MGVDTRAAVFVGLPRKEIENQELIDNDELEVCPPHYDGGGDDDAIAGFELAGCDCYSASEFVWDQSKCDELKAEFKSLTGQDAKVWLSPYVF
jgi:hypothetical protein